MSILSCCRYGLQLSTSSSTVSRIFPLQQRLGGERPVVHVVVDPAHGYQPLVDYYVSYCTCSWHNSCSAKLVELHKLLRHNGSFSFACIKGVSLLRLKSNMISQRYLYEGPLQRSTPLCMLPKSMPHFLLETHLQRKKNNSEEKNPSSASEVRMLWSPKFEPTSTAGVSGHGSFISKDFSLRSP